jgi:steroid delta-isomerase
VFSATPGCHQKRLEVPVIGSLARATAEAYVEAVNAVDLDGLVALFADDAVLDHASGRFEGTEAIRTFHAENVLAFAPQVTSGDWVEQGRAVTFHLEASVDGARSQAVDHLTVDDAGRIVHLEVGFH